MGGLGAAATQPPAGVDAKWLDTVAQDLLAIAREGLKRRGRARDGLADESSYLLPLDEIAATLIRLVGTPPSRSNACTWPSRNASWRWGTT